MKIQRILSYSLVMGTLLLLNACGGGGSKAPDTVVKGVAQAGIFNGATVKIYGYNGSGNLVQLTTSPATITTDSTGNYTANLGSYTGAVVVKVFGTFHDEASNSDILVTEDKALQGAVASASGTVSLPVTPLTDVAVRKAAAAGAIKDGITASNKAVSDVFGFDIVATTPVAPTTGALGTAGVTDNQKKYTTALITLSQYVKDISTTPSTPTAADLVAALTQISTGITTSGTTTTVSSPQVALNLQQAAASLSSNTNVSTVVTAAGTAGNSVVSGLTAIGNSTGSKILAVKLQTVGTFPQSPIYGVDAVVTIPSGAAVRVVGSSAQTVLGVVGASGNSLSPDTLVSGNLLSPTSLKIVVGSTGKDISGEFATVYFDVPASSTLTAADFSVSGSVIYDDSTTKGLTASWPMATF